MDEDFEIEDKVERDAQEVIGKLLEFGFLTGSRAWGTNTTESDWDIAFSVGDTQLVDGLLPDENRTESEYFGGYYVAIGGVKINLIPLHPHAFLPWFLTTEAFKATFKLTSIKDPIKKYSLFEGMVAMFKATTSELGDLNTYHEQNQALLKSLNTEVKGATE